MAFDIVPVVSRSERRDFLSVPETVYRADPNWIPPLRKLAAQQIDEARNPLFRHTDIKLWVAYRDGRPVGRISAQINKLHLALHNDATGHFGLLEAVEDIEVFRGLLWAAEDWLRGRNLKRILGPFNLSINEECGFMVEGAAERPTVMMGYCPRYYADYVERLGFCPAKDIHAYHFDLTNPLPEEVRAFLSKPHTGKRITVRHADTRRLHEEIRTVIDVYNDSLAGNWCFVPFTEDELAYAADALRLLVQPENIVIAECDGEPAGVILGIPDLNEAIFDLKGRLFPFGWVKLLYRLHRGVSNGRVLLFGVGKAHHSTFTGALLAAQMLRYLHDHRRKNFKTVEFSWILGDNARMLDMVRRSRARLHKKYRVYQKALGI